MCFSLLCVYEDEKFVVTFVLLINLSSTLQLFPQFVLSFRVFLSMGPLYMNMNF